MTERTQLLLDRALLLSVLLDREPDHAELLRTVAERYETLLYEAAGASGIEKALRSRADLADKLVAIPESAITVDDEERQLLRTTIEEAPRCVSVLRAHARYDRKVGGRRGDSGEMLAYVVRMLLLARQFDADLLPWPPRGPVILGLFEAAGVATASSESAGTIAAFTFDAFPHVPPRPPRGQPSHFRLLLKPEAEAASHLALGVRPDVTTPQTRALSAPRNDRTIFISYSHRDRRWLDLLTTMLHPLVREGALDVWSDRRIASGADWRAEIEQALNRAEVAVLLVTANFLASDFVARNELPPLFAAAATRRTTIAWIPVSGSLYQETELGRLQAIHDPAIPLDTLPPAKRQQALVAIAEKIVTLANPRSVP